MSKMESDLRMSNLELEYWRAVLILDLLAAELLTD